MDLQALAAALVATALGLLVPRAIALLPEPAGAEEKESYVAVARRRGLGPGCGVAGLLLGYAVLARLGHHPVAWVVVLLTPVLLLLTVVDWRTRLLPRVVVLPATGVLLVLAVLEWLLGGSGGDLVRALAGMLIARSAFWLLWWIRRAGMGFGDVRLAALVGLVLGRLGWPAWFVGMYAGLLVFAVFGISLAAARRDRGILKRAYPYGPFMVLGLYAGVLLAR